MARIFLSYNRSNVDTVTALVEDLKAARHELWFDSVLSGGQLWWDEILSNIRDCQIFLYALSKPSLESRACRAELQYALALTRPWIPVMIADDVSINLLPAPFDTIQFVDYRRQDKQAAIDLMTALMRMPAPGPLPQPLPEAPPVPLSYLRNIKDQIETTSALSLPEQTAIVTDLKEHLSEGRSALEVTELLKQLKRRDDLMAKVLSSIDTMLDGIPAAGAASVPRKPEPVHSNQRMTDGTGESACQTDLSSIGEERNGPSLGSQVSSVLSTLSKKLGLKTVTYNGHKIEIGMLSTLVGQDTVWYDGKEVSKKLSKLGSKHSFHVVEDGGKVFYEVIVKPRWHGQTQWFEVKRNGEVIFNDRNA